MRRLLAICFAVVFLDAAFFAALAPILPTLTRELDLSSTSAGVLTGSYGAGVLIFAIPGGWYAAKHGAKPAVLLGLVGMGLFSVAFGVAEAVWLLDVSRFMQGASGALLWVGAMSWVISSGPEDRRGELIGVLVAAATVGEMLGAPIGALAHALGKDVVFGAIALVSAVIFACAFPLPEARRIGSSSLRTLPSAIRGTGVLPSVWLLGAAAFAFGVVIVLAPLRLDSLGASAVMIALAFAAGSIVETFVGPLTGRISDRVGRQAPFQLGAILATFAILGIATLDARWLVAAALLCFSFAAGMAFAPALALTADRASGAGIDQGYASGFTNVAFGGGQMLGALSAGALAASSDLLPAAVTAVVLLTAAVLAGSVLGGDSAGRR
ncbi:MAG: MFS transporter [Solirubrobacterales bacterium]